MIKVNKHAAIDLLIALKAAKEHLDYCGYGDSWERECAEESKLEEMIDTAIAKAEMINTEETWTDKDILKREG